jgi:hypothetical protein
MQRSISSCLRFAVTAALLLIGINSYSAPLTWFPGPSADMAFSGAAAVSDSRLGNIVIGGDGIVYPENLVVSNNNWSILQMPVYPAYAGPGVVDQGDFILLFGGSDGSNSVSTVIDYSPSDNPTNVASMSVARSYLGYAPDASSDAYAIGGLDGNGNPLSSVECFSQDANSWSTKASMPVAIYDFPAVFDHTNQIYVFGGYTNTTLGGEVATAFRYSVNGNNWTPIAPMPIATANSGAAFGADGKIYVVGGVSGGVIIDTVQVYNPAANSWSISTPLPERLTAAAVGVDSEGRLLVAGGKDTNGDDVTDVWRSQQLGIPDSPPVFTQFPTTNGIYGSLYSSVIAATGNPQPTYSVVSGPAGLAVDLYSGAITWTPQGGDEIGNIPVTLQASNYAGSTNWTFTITVPPPPPTVPTNFIVVSANDTSVILSWSPESPLVGSPVTYKIYRVTVAGKGFRFYTLYATSPTNSVTIGLATGTTYEFVVTATVGSHSTGYSSEIAARTTSPQPPPNVHLTSLTSTSFSLAWNSAPGPGQNASFSAIASYSISQYVPASGGYTLIPKITAIPTNITSGTVTGLAPGSGAFWVVQAVDAQGYSSAATYQILGITTPVPSAAQMTVGAQASKGTFQFSATEGGVVLQTVLIQATTNPADPNSWQQIGSVFPGANPFIFTDTNAYLYPLRFYRIVAQ